MECPLYNECRLHLLCEINKIYNFQNMSDDDKFVFLMSCNNGDTDLCKHVINYVHQIWEIRKKTKTTIPRGSI